MGFPLSRATLPTTGIAYCNQLFERERKFKTLSPEERKRMRLEKEEPVLDAFWSWVETSIQKVLSKSNIGKALQYAQNHKYLEFILSRLPGSDLRANPKALNLMMPWDELIQKTCKSD